MRNKLSAEDRLAAELDEMLFGNPPPTAGTARREAMKGAPELAPCSDAARREGCTCTMSSINSASVDPPEPRIDQWCPLHGRDPDAEREKRRDDR